MVLLEKLWDDVVAGPQPERGLGRLRKLATSKPLVVAGQNDLSRAIFLGGRHDERETGSVMYVLMVFGALQMPGKAARAAPEGSTSGRYPCRRPRGRPPRRRPRRRPARRTCGGACSTRGATSPPRRSAASTSTSRSPTPPPSTTGCTVVRLGASIAEAREWPRSRGSKPMPGEVAMYIDGVPCYALFSAGSEKLC
ncbi:hypothetical protein EUGRSUZ_D00606 [Eucalyptus grandis]|uniref:Uncharacterized protein n=2 Tax=Eucalyptus grandis TaxID=71139 RepID=A0ACC3L3E6_EUCGR|nr:hypothetical protein EUGRSUZ_D00606 [Eucalyptus grandis]